MRFAFADSERLTEHYSAIAHKAFFPEHLKFMTSAPVVMVRI
jgi:nucleoside diphosphate kinase